MAYIQLYYEFDSKGKTTPYAEYSVILETNKKRVHPEFINFPSDTKPNSNPKGVKPKKAADTWVKAIDPIVIEEAITDYYIAFASANGGTLPATPNKMKEADILALLYALGERIILVNVIEIV